MQPPPWTTCASSTPPDSVCASGNGLAGATWHQMSIECAYNQTSGAFDLKIYVDHTSIATATPVLGASIFTETQKDPVLGNDTRCHIDALQIFNETFGGNPPAP